LLADLWLIHDVRSAKLDQLFHIVLDQLSRSAQLSRLNIPSIVVLFVAEVLTQSRTYDPTSAEWSSPLTASNPGSF